MQDSKNGLEATQKRAHPRHKARASIAAVYGTFFKRDWSSEPLRSLDSWVRVRFAQPKMTVL